MIDAKSQCPSCGKAASRPNATFCPRCGASLTAGVGRTETTDRRSFSAKIVVRTTDGGIPEEFTLTGVLTTLGRHESNTIPLSHPIISRHHAKIERTRQGHTLTDLNSTNGTFVNGQRLTPNVPRLLAPNDVIHLGQVSGEATWLTYLVLAPASVADKAVVSPPPTHLPAERIKTLEFNRSLAVVIGVDDYRHGIPPLRTARKDAQRLAQILKNDYGYDVQLLIKDVTLERLNSLLTDSLANEVGPKDRVLFYFAGHGIALEGDDGPAGYLVPQDGRPEDRATFLRMDHLHDALMSLECRHMLVILDCCFAGAMRWSITRDVQIVPEIIHQERYERFIRDPAWQLITSAAYDQKALDILSGDVLGERGDTPSREHSPFALALFEALAGAGDVVPPGEGDGVITACELYLYLRQRVEDRTEKEVGHNQTPRLWPLKKHDKGEYIFLVPGHELNLPPAPELTTENNPYRGLQPFEEEHAKLFFGRKDLVGALAETVSERPLTVVLGASGTGKSSLVKAGLLPHLGGTGEADLVTSGEKIEDPWYILPPMRPTESPLRELEHLIRHNLPASVQTARDGGGRAAPIALADVIARWGQAHPGQRLLLVIDQSEELVTLCRNDREREQFLRLLSTALDTVPDQLRIVLTLRSDFEPQLSDSALQAHWRDSRFVVPPMSRAELREAITEPAAVRVLYFEPSDLIDHLIDEVIQTPGALPLLSFTLSELYIKYIQRRSDDRALTEEDYRALGGVAGSLRNRATEEYNALASPYQATMKRVMLRMIATEGGELARRRVDRSELVYADEVENRRVETVIQRLTAVRLIVMGETEEGEPYVEPAHDALVRAWDRLLIWTREAEEYLPLQRRLAQAAKDWVEATEKNTKKDLLWHNDPRLPQVEQALAGDIGAVRQGWLARQFARFRDLWSTRGLQVVEGHWLNRLELNFVQQSVNQRRKETRRLVGTVAGVIAALVVLTLFSLFALNRANVASDAQATEIVQRTTAQAGEANAAATAVAERDIALSRQLAAQSARELDADNYQVALLLAVESGRSAETAEAFAAIRQAFAHPRRVLLTLFGRTPRISQAVWNSDESRILTAEVGRAQVWDAATGARQLVLSDIGGAVRQAVWNSDGSRILTASDDGKVRMWDAETGRELRTVAEHDWRGGQVNQAMWNFDESHVLTASDDGTARVWDAETGAQSLILSGHTARVGQAMWNSDESRILTASDDGTARVWDAEIGEEMLILSGHEVGVNQAAWNFDESRILTASDDGTARVWDAETGEELLILSGHKAETWQAAWNLDGSRILTASNDGTARVWDAETGEELLILFGHEAGVLQAAWNSDESRILTASDDGTAQVWDAEMGEELLILSGHEGGVKQAVWNSDESCILTTSGDGTVQVWDAVVGGELPAFSNHTDWVNQAVWNSDESRILTTGWNNIMHSQDGTVRVWDVETGKESLTLFDRADTIFGWAMWNSDESRILATRNDGTAGVWDAETGEELFTLASNGEQAMWNSDESRILTADRSGMARVWDAETGEELLSFPAHAIEVNQAVWNSGEGRILTAGCDRGTYEPYTHCIEGTARVWDAVTGEELLALSGHAGGVKQAMWNSDESRILTASDDGTARVWDAETGAELFTLSGHAGGVNQAVWNSDSNLILTAGCDRRDDSDTLSAHLPLCLEGTARVWDAETGAELVTLFGHASEVWRAVWNSDESRILSTGGDNIARVCDAETGEELFTLSSYTVMWSGHTAAWNSDESRILTVSGRGTVQQWYTKMEDLLAGTCQRVIRNMTREEWQQFMKHEKYRATCPNLPIEEER